MADSEPVEAVDVEAEEEEGYQPPKERTIDEMLKTDVEDESLQKYKEALLGSAAAGSGAVVVDEKDPR